MPCLGHRLDLRREITLAVFGQVAAGRVDRHLRSLLAADQTMDRQPEHLARRILGGHVDAGNAPGHRSLDAEMVVAGQHLREDVLDIEHMAAEQVPLDQRQHGEIHRRHAPAFADAFGAVRQPQANQGRGPRACERFRHSIAAAGGKLRLQGDERDVFDDHGPSHSSPQPMRINFSQC